MIRISKIWLVLLTSLLAVSLSGCIEEDGDEDYEVGGSIYGLNGELILVLEGWEVKSFKAEHTENQAIFWSFAETLEDEDSFSVSIKTQPVGQDCSLEGGSGAISGEHYYGVRVQCITSGEVLTGVLLDSPVANIGYRINGVDFTTNDQGEFSYSLGDDITFFIGSLVFPAIKPQAIITPIDLSYGAQDPEVATNNILRLLQTLDVDANLNNGISITSHAATVASEINFNLSSENFSVDAAVLQLIGNAGQDTSVSALVTPEAAASHFETTLINAHQTFNPILFDESLTDMILEEGEWSSTQMTFQAGEFTVSGSHSASGQYDFSVSNKVISLTFSTGDEEGDNHNEFVVFKAYDSSLKVYEYCWIDDVDVISAIQAERLCRLVDDSQVDLIQGYFVVDPDSVEQIMQSGVGL